jgi:hybrid cluster-associated redox disulfide protein
VQATVEREKERVIFTREMSIMEAIQVDPRARDIFEALGIDCVGCSGVSLESIAAGAKLHGVDVEVLLADLNKLVSAGSSQGD